MIDFIVDDVKQCLKLLWILFDLLPQFLMEWTKRELARIDMGEETYIDVAVDIRFQWYKNRSVEFA